jgi:hypothetical protein
MNHSNMQPDSEHVQKLDAQIQKLSLMLPIWDFNESISSTLWEICCLYFFIVSSISESSKFLADSRSEINVRSSFAEILYESYLLRYRNYKLKI